MFKIKYFWKLSLAYLSHFKGLIFVGVVLGMLSFLFVQLFRNYFISQTERIGVTGRFQSDDLPQSILNLVSFGLTSIDENNLPIPGLASSWETPDKGKTWIFHIKDGLEWQDGSDIDNQSLSYEFSDVKLSKEGDKRLVFSLENSFSPFPLVVSKPVFKKGLLGVGEWKVTKITFQSTFIKELVLEKVDNNNLKKIFKFYPNEDSSKLGFKLGEVSRLESLFNPTPFDTWRNTKVEEYVDTNQVVTLLFNTKDDILSEKSLRQALAYAIDKDKLGIRAYGPISPNSWVYNPQVKQYAYDSERAKELIDDLPDEIRDKLEINLFSSPNLLDVAEKISEDWEKIGVKSKLQVSSIVPSEFDAYLTIYQIPPDPDQYSMWHSTQEATNISEYSNVRVDKLLEDGRVELDLEERKKIYLDFQRFLLEDLPAVFLHHPKYYNVSRYS